MAATIPTPVRETRYTVFLCTFTDGVRTGYDMWEYGHSLTSALAECDRMNDGNDPTARTQVIAMAKPNEH